MKPDNRFDSGFDNDFFKYVADAMYRTNEETETTEQKEDHTNVNPNVK